MKPAMLLVLVHMTMMQVRIMRVGMTHISVAMNMRMRFGHRPFMRVLMMCIMDVGVFMFQVAMAMVMVMPLSQMQPKTNGHQNCSDDELKRGSLTQKCN